jgi:hypothetical protein
MVGRQMESDHSIIPRAAQCGGECAISRGVSVVGANDHDWPVLERINLA